MKETEDCPMKNAQEIVTELLTQDQALTVDEMATRTGIKASTLQRRIGLMHRAKEVHIWDWKRGRRREDLRAMWALGNEEDAPCIYHPEPDMSALKALKALRIASEGWNPFRTAMWNLAQASGERG